MSGQSTESIIPLVKKPETRRRRVGGHHKVIEKGRTAVGGNLQLPPIGGNDCLPGPGGGGENPPGRCSGCGKVFTNHKKRCKFG